MQKARKNGSRIPDDYHMADADTGRIGWGGEK